jgi:xanthine dehydrogenase iron-sulfur cluster and FAD-binding subunit A
LQERFKEEHVLQCGFCTPGFLMTTTALAREPRPTPLSRQEIKEELAGVLCRCTGYEFIVTAVERHLASLAADSSDDEVSVRDLASAAGDRAHEDVSVGDLASATGDSSHG